MELQTLGKYNLDRVIGRGAMGVIYEAFDTVLHRKVAIKTMTGELTNDPNLRKRFYMEARAAANLHHVNIITIHDLGEEGRTPYIVMELLEGTDLKSLFQQEKTLSFARILQIGAQASHGLNYAHANNVVHRDIKPANVFVCSNDTVKILDFGVAHVVSSTLTQAGMLLGSIGYMAPEQIVGQKVDGRADQYSVGVILYELVTGVKPFIEKDITATIHAIMKNPPVPPRNIRDDCPPEVEKIVLRCLSKNREDRYPSMLEVAKAMESALDSGRAAEAAPVKVSRTLADISVSGKALPLVPPQMETREWLSIQELLSQTRSKVQNGEVQEAFGMLKEHYKIYQKDPEFLTCFRQVKAEKESFDKKALLQKHYHDALKLLDEDNFKLARLELETLLKIEPSSVLISQLEQEITHRETLAQLQEWVEEADKILTAGQWLDLARHVGEGRSRFRRDNNFLTRETQLAVRVEKAVQKAYRHAEQSLAWKPFVDAVAPLAALYPDRDGINTFYSEAQKQAGLQQVIVRLQEWVDQSEELLAQQKWREVDIHLASGDLAFQELPEYRECRANVLVKREKAEIAGAIQDVAPLEAQGQWAAVADMLRPILRKYPESRILVEKYNQVMKDKLEKERQDALRDFLADQARIVDSMLKTQQLEQAKKYLMVLLDKYPGTPEFEDRMIDLENRLGFQRSVAEIRGLIEAEDYGGAADLFQMLREAYPDEVQLEILKHELENLRMTLDTRNLRANMGARLQNALQLVEKGAFDRALEIVQSLMKSNPEHTSLYAISITIEGKKASYERDTLLAELREIERMEKDGEMYFACEKAASLVPRFPGEASLPTLSQALRKKYVDGQVDRIRAAVGRGALKEAQAIIETNNRLFPDETSFGELAEELDMESRKTDFITAEMGRVRQALAENRVDEALEIVNSLIPLVPENQELKDILKDIVFRKTRKI